MSKVEQAIRAALAAKGHYAACGKGLGKVAARLRDADAIPGAKWDIRSVQIDPYRPYKRGNWTIEVSVTLEAA